MEAQWPLILFTLFVCITCGLLGAGSILAIKGKVSKIQLPIAIAAGASLVLGGLSSFAHLQHWERIFNGFGHITSGITQELIGCVLLAIVIALWVMAIVKKKPVSKGVAIATLVVSVAMVVATAHSYLMAARPAWTTLIVYYLGNACLLGTVTLWLIAKVTKDEEVEDDCSKLTFISALISLATDAIYVVSLAAFKIYDFGFYADPVTMTTAPTHVSSLIGEAVMGVGAPVFWVGVVTALLVVVFALFAKKNPGQSMVMVILAVICALATSVCFRVLIYVIGYTSCLIY